MLYESDSIVQENRKIQENLNSSEIIDDAWSGDPFDYYLIGHYICHHGGMWDITSHEEKGIKLLVQGLKSCNDSSKGKLQKLSIINVDLSELDPILVIDLQQLDFQHVTFTESSVNIIREFISSDGALRSVDVNECEQVELLFPIVFESSLLRRFLLVNRRSLHISDDAMNLLVNNSNIKLLILDFPLKLPAHTVCHNASLDFLAKRLLVFISSKQTLPYIKISDELSEFDVSFYFMKTSASNGEPRTVFTISIYKSCDYNVTQQILVRIPEQYRTL